jgi:hypothetical protein
MLNFDVMVEVLVLGTESAAFVYLVAAAGPANFLSLNNSNGIHVTFKALSGGSSAQVEEPSAALSLPIGVLGLAGLAAMKGGAS